MTLRQTKQNEFFVHHMETFKKLGLPDPFFTIKTAFFQKGKFGRQVQFFEWELKKGEDIYIEFYDNVNDDMGQLVNIKPFHDERLLFKFKVNPHFAEEYELKVNTNSKGEEYSTYTVSLMELTVVLPHGREMAFPAYEKSKEQAAEEAKMPRLQNSLTFPDFEEEFGAKEVEVTAFEENVESAGTTLANISLKDFAAIMLVKPVSDKKWLNDLIKEAKSEI
jgi:hypothetical protein